MNKKTLKLNTACPAKRERCRGFTLIEIMIAITLFSVIMILGSGAVLRTNATYKKTQTLRAVMDNLSFVMEDMARNLRLGSNYHCFANGESYIQPTPQNTQDCAQSSTAISFIPVTGTNNDIVYRLEPTNLNAIEKSKDGGVSFATLTPTEVVIDSTKSGFTVIGADPADLVEPRVIIRLVGTVTFKTGLESSFNLQTTVSQRLLDR